MKFIFVIIFFFFLMIRDNAAGEINITEQGEKMEALKNNLKKYIDNQNEIIAVSFSIPGENRYFGINDTIVFHAASTMKVPVMCEVFKRVQTRDLRLTDTIIVKNEFISIMDGSKFQLDIADDSGDTLYSMIGQTVLLEFLVRDMITVSGNLSTNILIDIVGAENVQALMRDIGANEMRVLRGVEDMKAFRAGKNNVTTARALTRIFEAIFNNEICNEKYSDHMLEILKDQKFRDKIPLHLPATVEVAHKTGSITGISHDAGIVYPALKSPYVLSILTSGYKDSAAAKETIAEISRQIYSWYTSS